MEPVLERLSLYCLESGHIWNKEQIKHLLPKHFNTLIQKLYELDDSSNPDRDNKTFEAMLFHFKRAIEECSDSCPVADNQNWSAILHLTISSLQKRGIPRLTREAANLVDEPVVVNLRAHLSGNDCLSCANYPVMRILAIQGQLDHLACYSVLTPTPDPVY